MKVEFSPVSHKEEIISINLILAHTETLVKYYWRFVGLRIMIEEKALNAVVVLQKLGQPSSKGFFSYLLSFSVKD